MATNLPEVSIEIPTPAHREGLLNLIKEVMLTNEPVEIALQFSWEEVAQGWATMIDNCIKEGNSHVAISKNQEVVGARLSRILDIKSMSPQEGLYDWMTGPGEKSKSFVAAFNQLTINWRSVLVKSDGLKCEKILQFMTLCVRPDFAKRGIALELTKENIKKAKEKGCGYCTCVATNWMSQRVFEKCDFRTVDEIAYQKYFNENGKPVFDVKDPKNPCMKWMVKEL